MRCVHFVFIVADGLSSDDEIGDYEAPPHTVTVVAWCYPGFGNLSLKALGNCSLRDFIYSTTCKYLSSHSIYMQLHCSNTKFIMFSYRVIIKDHCVEQLLDFNKFDC